MPFYMQFFSGAFVPVTGMYCVVSRSELLLLPNSHGNCKIIAKELQTIRQYYHTSFEDDLVHFYPQSEIQDI